jgi:hypothetical protein
MTETETKWAARVEEWRASGATAAVFCKGKEFAPGCLRYWSSRLRKRAAQGAEVQAARVVRAAAVSRSVTQSRRPRKGARSAPRPEGREVRLARVVRSSASVVETPVVIEIGSARVGVRRGFDAATLRSVLDVLGAGR